MAEVENIRHSLSHVLAMAVLEKFPAAKLGIGPVIENGFYYDFTLPAEALAKAGLPELEQSMRKIIGKNHDFEGKKVTKLQARKLFKDQLYKLELVEEYSKEGRQLTVYKTGGFTDLCKGGHVKNTKEIPIDAFKLTKIAGAYWRGSEKNPMLTRIYGVAFTAKKELDEYLRIFAELEKRDHRKLGEQLDLFSFQEIAPGAAFWHPKGMIIIKELEKWWREEHEKRGYLETSTPIMVKREVFEKSEHWEHYKENIFTLEVEKEAYALKPMNCPESTYIYSSKIRSYKDLPLRLSEIGRLHRNELSGVLAGLFRVRQLTMDDAHIYAREDQIQPEIKELLKFIKEFYKMFGFISQFKLATRPDSLMGNPKLWDKAEKALSFALKQNKIKYELKPKDGSFYGPKIDIHIEDALKRSWQMATIQLDFQIPEKFNLYYVDQKGKKQRPIIIHRAIFGSFERFIGILIEHFAGALPFWLSPEQIWIIPVGSRHEKYAKEVGKMLWQAGFRFQVKDENETVSKKIRGGEIQKIPYLVVVGDQEIKTKSVRVRERGKGDIGPIKLDKFVNMVNN